MSFEKNIILGSLLILLTAGIVLVMKAPQTSLLSKKEQKGQCVDCPCGVNCTCNPCNCVKKAA